MTGVAEVYLFLRRPYSKNARKRLLGAFQQKRFPKDINRFVVLAWKRTGSNLLCGILYNHPEILMHNELFNPIDIFTYYPNSLQLGEELGHGWNFRSRDLLPIDFLTHIWAGKLFDGTKIKEGIKAIGFKSFPDHWTDSNNDDIWLREIMEDRTVKKIVLHREDELAVFLSMKRAEITGSYMTRRYPHDLKVHIDVQEFQTFINNYRYTFQQKYKSPFSNQDTFRISYEQLVHEDQFDAKIASKLWEFIGVNSDVATHRLDVVQRQSIADEVIESIISNYDELRYAFCHTDVSHFSSSQRQTSPCSPIRFIEEKDIPELVSMNVGSWSILLPICSRSKVISSLTSDTVENRNRFSDLEWSSSYSNQESYCPDLCWKRIVNFADSFRETVPDFSRAFEFIVGIDEDDPVFNLDSSRDKLRNLLPGSLKIVLIKSNLYGKVCRIWNRLGEFAENDFLVLLGDDVILHDKGWPQKVVQRFKEISENNDLPFGAGCVAMNDLSFRGFPSFPIIHRWHIENFKTVLPRMFVNQGGDPFLYELYSRWNAATFVDGARLSNTLGGDDFARYKKHVINWQGQVLNLQTKQLQKYLDKPQTGICIDIVVPSYRCNNSYILRRILSLRASRHIYVRFWVIIDNPDEENLFSVKALANDMNSNLHENNYFVNVVHYGENRGASHARNVGYNYSTADWVLFIDDDVLVDDHLLDAYVGSIMRYPQAKVMVGYTEIPSPINLWTKVLKVSNIMHFYGIAQHRNHPPWGVTANMMVRGSRHNHTIQFKHIYPKTGGGEDIDFVFQVKEMYGGSACVVATPGAKALHPWWKNGMICYDQIIGWAWGDSLCLKEWSKKTFLVFPNWVEANMIILTLLPFFGQTFMFPLLLSGFSYAVSDHLLKGFFLYSNARKLEKNVVKAAGLALLASTVISCQEITRAYANLVRFHWTSFCRQMDWFDGQARIQIMDTQLRSFIMFSLNLVVLFFLLPTSQK